MMDRLESLILRMGCFFVGHRYVDLPITTIEGVPCNHNLVTCELCGNVRWPRRDIR